MYFNKTYFDENNNPSEVQVICDKCGKIISVTDMSKFQTIQNDYCAIREGQYILCICGNRGKGLIEYKKNPKLDEIVVKKHSVSANSNKAQCPTCGSTNLKKISTTAKAMNTAFFGLVGTKRYKTFHCNNCGYEW